MSYTKSYHESLLVTGTVTVSYPASEHGGVKTASYSQRVPIDFDVTVDTDPFDTSIGHANTSVAGLTGSVVAMDAAQCKAIADSADDVSKHLIDGFYNVINSDLTSKQAEAFSLLQSKTALLFALSQDMHNMHIRMNDDLKKLWVHFSKTFKDLDETQHRRIMELDRRSFELADKVRETILVEPFMTLGAATVDALSGTNQTVGKLSMARIKRKSSSALSRIGGFIRKNLSYRDKMEHILENTQNSTTEKECIPVVYGIENGGNPNAGAQWCVSAPIENAEGIRQTVSDSVRSIPQSGWKTIDNQELANIDRAFSALVQKEFQNASAGNEQSARVYSEMMKLWQKGKTGIHKIQY